jgi:hypothetical protein
MELNDEFLRVIWLQVVALTVILIVTARWTTEVQRRRRVEMSSSQAPRSGR